MNISWGEVIAVVIAIVAAQVLIDWYQKRQNSDTPLMPTPQETVQVQTPPQTVLEYVRMNYPNAL